MARTIQTAVLPLAGAGTREFPITTAIEKCLMPIYAGKHSRTVLDFMLDDCLAAGLQRLIFITSERGKLQIENYIGELDPHIRQQLVSQGKHEILRAEEERRDRFKAVHTDYVFQQPEHGYGTTVPLFLAKPLLTGETHFGLLGGDDFVYREDGASETKLALEAWETSGADHVIMNVPVPHEEGPKYGILQTDPTGRLTGWDERPPLERVPDHPVVSISRYLLKDSIWDYVDQEVKKHREGEHYITYPILAALANGQSFQLHEVQGRYIDGGSFDGLLNASLYFSGRGLAP